MVNFGRQLKFLLWKCVLVRSRQKFWLSVELILPCVLFIIIALVRTRNFDQAEQQCHFDSKAMLSAGILPFIHSFFCSFSNQCHVAPTTGDEQRYLFDDYANMTTNETIIVDFIHYTSLQLKWIGEHPTEFEQILNSTAEIIHFIANLNQSSPGIIRIGELFEENTRNDLIREFTTAGVDEITARQLMNLTIKPGILDFRKHVDNIFGNPLFCDPRIFNSSFFIEMDSGYTANTTAEICDKLMIIDLVTFQKYSDLAVFPTPSRMKIMTYIEQFKIAFQPTLDFLNKYSNSTVDQILDALFCGSNPKEVIEQTLNPNSDILVETPFEKLRKRVIKYIENVSPGKEEHKNGTCLPVNFHSSTNCSALEGPLLSKVLPILQGFILVSPDNPATRNIVESLNKPLQNLEFLRSILFEYPSESINLQWQLHNSDLWPASQRILKWIEEFNSGQNPFNNGNVRFILEHIFADPSDEYSFGSVTGNLTKIFNMYSSCFLIDRFRIVKNEKELESNALCLMEEDQYFSGIVFNISDSASSFPDFTTYKIRHFPDFVDSTTGLMDSKSNPFSRHMPFRDLKYIMYGFSFLQEAVDRALIAQKSSNPASQIGAFAQQEPYPCTVKDTFNVALFMPLFLLISFIFPSALLVKNIVYEKELRIKEQMRSMGLGDAVHFLSWSLISLLLNFISVLVISIISKLAKIFENTDYTLLLFILILFLFSSIAMSLFFSTLFTNANIATAATCVLWFVFFTPFQLKSDKIKTPTFNRIMLILPPTAMGNCFKLLESFNAVEKATWSDLGEMVNPAYGLSMTLCMTMLVIDTFVFLILAWYISAVAPGVYGVSQRWYFPFTVSYWFPSLHRNRVEYSDEENFDIIPASDLFDSDPIGLKLTVHINSMSKIYSNGTKALNKLNLRLYENQITGLLGHNGAGKTTTMSILCGLYAPTSGTARIYSRDIRSDLGRVREVLGICPQHNVLFTHLTVAEQLGLFAALKGVADNEIAANVAEILESVGLTEKADKLAGTLSGGMKRRLCIGIAFIGGSKFVILDEPTAGVDVTARKDIWKLLQRNKEGRTILLSTHHMDEADVLSDRIAILSHGQCITVGSSMFLKRRFGNQLSLSIEKGNVSANYAEIAQLVEDLGSQINIKLENENEEELVFGIPIQTDSDRLERFFSVLDEKLEEFQLGQYGISAPSLQNIFVSLAPQKEYQVPTVDGCNEWIRKIKGKIMRIPADEEHSDLIDNPAPSVGNNAVNGNNEIEDVKFEDFEKPELLEGYHLRAQHIWALLVCRFNYTMKSKRTFLFQVIIPLLLLALCEFYVVIQVSSGRPDLEVTQPPLPLETSVFGNISSFYVNSWDTRANSTPTQLLHSLLNSPGAGPRCANGEPIEEIRQMHAYLHYRNTYGWGRHTPAPGVSKTVVETAYHCGQIEGTFNYSPDISNISYNEPIDCECVDFGWNCTLEDWNWRTIDWIRLNTTDRVYDLTARNLTQFRLITLNKQINNNTSPFFLGGLSLGHLNRRAQTASEVESAKHGWTVLQKEFLISCGIIGLNLSNIDSHETKIIDPFVGNLTFTNVLYSILENLDVQENVKVWFNNKIWPSYPLVTNVLSNTLMRYQDRRDDPDNLGILTLNHPMNKSISQSLDSTTFAFAQALSLFRITCLLLVLSMIPAGFTVYLVEDRVSEAFHLQLVGGLRKTTYWITSYIYDMMVYTCVIIVIMLIYLAFGVPEFALNPSTFFSYLLVFFAFGMCSILYAYVFQKWFSIAALSFVLLAIGSYFVGVVCALTVILIESLMQRDPTLVPAHDVCSIVFLILPQYNLGLSIFRGSMVYQVRTVGANFLRSINRPDLIDQLPLPGLLDMDVMGIHVICLFGHVFLASMCLIFSQMEEFAFMRRRERIMTESLMLKDQSNDEDEDVIKEKKRVDTIPHNVHNYSLVVRNLAKAYTSESLAVRGISFAVEPGECFGLLGLNGAGKTTTFSMLTAKSWPGHGAIEMANTRITPISSTSNRSFRQLGYCPQFDALNMRLTTRENLKFYARIRGIQPADIESIVDRLLQALHLRSYAGIETSSLSGGNRRKLSVAVALVSQPSLVFLDEPSAGMDPGSQQFLWRVIERLCKSGKAVVLTSHSMEECEALCTRIAIMDRGRIRCLGGKQHLKNKFGNGSMLTIKLGRTEEAREVGGMLESKIYGAKVEAIHCTTCFIHIKQSTSTIAQILEAVNKAKRVYKFDDFTLTQSTLDNVFQSISENSEIVSSGSDADEQVGVSSSNRDQVYIAEN